MKINKWYWIVIGGLYFGLCTILAIHNQVNILLALFIGAIVLAGLLLLMWLLGLFIIKNCGLYIRTIEDEDYHDDGWDSPFIN